MTKISGLEARIMDFLFKNGTLQSMKYIKAAFPGESQASIQKALNNLCELGLVAHFENVIFKPYGTIVERNQVYLDL